MTPALALQLGLLGSPPDPVGRSTMREGPSGSIVGEAACPWLRLHPELPSSNASFSAGQRTMIGRLLSPVATHLYCANCSFNKAGISQLAVAADASLSQLSPAVVAQPTHIGRAWRFRRMAPGIFVSTMGGQLSQFRRGSGGSLWLTDRTDGGPTYWFWRLEIR